jgi:hypothetical protein
VNVGGVNYNVSYDDAAKTFTVSGPYGFAGYVGSDGLLYVDMGGGATNVYSFNESGNNEFVLKGTLTAADYLNYEAMYSAANLGSVGNRAVDIIANSAISQPMRSNSAATISDALVLASGANNLAGKKQIFLNVINYYYNQNTGDSYNPGSDAGSLFGGMGSLFSPMLIFSTGEFGFGLMGEEKSPSIKEATFENLAPMFWSNMNHLFMSVVAVQSQNGTSGVSKVSEYDGSVAPGKIILSSYNFSPDTVYASRACGMAGKGTAEVDPWCFAAAGSTGEQAVSAMAGAVAAVGGAFPYMSAGQIFTLLALTSDGALLSSGNNNGLPKTEAELASFLQGKYELPPEYIVRVENGENYLSVFAEVFGYGLVNLERATRPNTSVYYASGTSIKGAQWRSASAAAVNGTAFALSGAFGSRAGSISVPVWDVLESADGSLSLPRVFENEFALSGGRRGIYLGDALGEFDPEKEKSSEGILKNDDKKDGLSFDAKFSESNRVSSMNGLGELSLEYKSGGWGLGAEYKRRLNDARGAVLRGDGSNPILSLASDAVSSGATWAGGGWTFGARAFSGQITDEQLLENDPAISGRYEPERLGFMRGAESSVGFAGEKFALRTSVGAARESDTLLGAYSGGLLGMGGGDTIYIDSIAVFAPTDSLKLTARATFASTHADPGGGAILDVSDIGSDAFALGAEFGGWSLSASLPLAVRSGRMRYATMDYEISDAENGYALSTNPYEADFDLAPESREARFSMAYRTRLGAATTGALGFVYRVNPDNTKDFGNESILMLKVKHSIGI